MGRLQNFAPLLDLHRLGEQIGVIEEVWLGEDRRIRARVKFSKSVKGEEFFQDVIDGIRRHVSIGYIIHEMVLTARGDNGDTYRIIDWEPYEISMASVPADPTVGVGRSENLNIVNIKVRGLEMDEDDVLEQQELAAQQRALNPAAPVNNGTDVLAQERSRVSEINALGTQFNLGRSMVADAIQRALNRPIPQPCTVSYVATGQW